MRNMSDMSAAHLLDCLLRTSLQRVRRAAKASNMSNMSATELLDSLLRTSLQRLRRGAPASSVAVRALREP